MEGSDKMSDSGELGTKMEGKNTALQEKCQTYLDLWAHRKEHLQQADKMAKVDCFRFSVVAMLFSYYFLYKSCDC